MGDVFLHFACQANTANMLTNKKSKSDKSEIKQQKLGYLLCYLKKPFMFHPYCTISYLKSITGSN